MGVAPDIAVPGTLLSTGLRPVHADPVGLSVLLLVPIRMGDRRLRASGACLSEVQELKVESWQGRIYAALPRSGEGVTGQQHTSHVTFQVGFLLRVVVRSCHCC